MPFSSEFILIKNELINLGSRWKDKGKDERAGCPRGSYIQFLNHPNYVVFQNNEVF